MANPNVQTLGLDASELIAGLTQASQTLKQHAQAVDDVTIEYVKYNKAGDAVRATGQMILESGQTVDVMLKKSKSGWDAYVTGVDNATKAMKEFAAAQSLQAGAAPAQNFMKLSGIPDAAGMKAAVMDAFKGVQENLAKAIGSDPNNVKIAQEIFDKLKKGTIEVETGIRGKIQGALLDVLRLSERIAAEQAKMNKPVAPVGATGMSATDLGTLRQQMLSIYPPVPGAALSSVAAYQATINSLMTTVQRSKMTMQEFAALFNSVSRNPSQDFAGSNAQLGAVQQAIQKVIVGYDQMKVSAAQAGEEGGKAGRSMILSFEQIVRLLEVTTIRHFFRQLITGVEESIGKAAEFQMKLTEIRIMAEDHGWTQTSLAQFLRQQGSRFGMNPSDVAGVTQSAVALGLMNSSQDTRAVEATLTLARTTASSAEDAFKALSTVMLAYGMNATEAERASAVLFNTVRVGQVRLSDLSSGLNRVVVLSSQVGVSLDEAIAVMVRMIRTGLTAGEAEGQIAGLINSFLRPSEEMRAMLQRMGFVSGEAAIRTLGLAGAIRTVNQEVQSGRRNLVDFTPNTRAMQAFMGRGDLDEINQFRQQLTDRGPAERSMNLLGENTAFQFEKELNKIRILWDQFGDETIKQVMKLTEPWGGLFEIVKSGADAFFRLANTGVQVILTFNNLATVLLPLGLNLGNIVQLWISYKIVVGGLAVIMGIASAAQSLYTSLEVAATASTTASAAAMNMNALSKSANVAATGALSTAVGANTAGQLSNAVATSTAAGSQIAMAAASRLLAIAMTAIPVVALVTAFMALTGQLDPVIDRLTGVTGLLDRIKNTSKEVTNLVRESTAEFRRLSDERDNTFRNELQTQERRGFDAFRALQQQAFRLIEANRTAVANTTESMRIAFRGVSQEMTNRLSDIQRVFSQSRSYVEESRRQALSFGDRDQSDNFRRGLAALSRRPEVVHPIDMSADQGWQQYIMETRKFEVEREQFAMQRQLIQQRISTLEQQANDLVGRGDHESMLSARRKFDEIRRLTEQMFDLQTGFNRRTAENEVLTGRAAPFNGILRYQVPLQQLQRELEGLTARETAAEQAHQRHMQARQDSARALETRERQRQQLLNDAIRQFEQFNVLEEGGQNGGRLRDRFRGPQGMENFQADWTRMQSNLRTAMDGGQFSPEARAQIAVALLNQQAALRQQIERQLFQQQIQGEQRLFQERVENLRRLQALAGQQQNELVTARGSVLERGPTTVTDMVQQVNNAEQLITRLNAIQRTAVGAGFSREAPFVNRINDQVPRLREQFLAAADIYRTANEALARAQNTPAEGQRLQELMTAGRELDRIYREIFALGGDRRLQNSQQTGNQVAGQSTNLLQNLEALQTFYNRQAETTRLMQQAQTQLNQLQNEADRAARALQGAGVNLNAIGNAAQENVPRVNNLADAVQRLVNELERLRNAPGIPNAPALPQAPAAPVAFEDAGFARGGLIGGMFNTFGPDNRLIAARDGEFVVNPNATQRFYSQLVAMNSGILPSFASGGLVGGSSVTNVGDIAISVHDSGDPNATARAVLGTLRRELRRGNGKL